MNNQHTPRDPHQILGLAPGATREQVNAAYRHALRRLHPDTRPPDDAAADRANPALTTHLSSDLTMADLQHARLDLLRAEQRRLEQGRAGRAEGGVRARDRGAPRPPLPRPDASSSPGPRRYLPGVGEPDIICGPVRYHGPPAGPR